MREENKKGWDRQRLKSRIRALGFVALLGTLCYLAIAGDGDLQEKVIGAVENLAFLAAGLYYKATGDKNEEKGSSK